MQKEKTNFMLTDNLTIGDPALAEVLKDCFDTICRREEDGKTSFFERGLKESIKDITKNGLAVRNRQAEGISYLFNQLLDKRKDNSWIESEKQVFSLIENLFFVKLAGEDGDITKKIGDYTQSLMELDYTKELPTFVLEGIKKNVFNYFGFAIQSVAESIKYSTVSKKAIDCYFKLYSDVAFIVTDNDFNIRTVNNIFEEFTALESNHLIDKPLFQFIPELGNKTYNFKSKESYVKEPLNVFSSQLGLRQTEFSFFKSKSSEQIEEFVFILDFNCSDLNTQANLHHNYNLLSDVITAIHDLRTECKDSDNIEKSTILLQNLYDFKEKTKLKLIGENEKLNVNELIDFQILSQHLQNELQYLTNVENVVFQLSNLNFTPFESDYDKIFSIVKNLVVNAIQYQQEESLANVQLKIEDQPNSILIEVSDNGIGINEKEFDLIFEKGVTTNKNNGLGLGLYLVRKNINYLGGTIKVKSELFEGTTFTVELPR